MSEKIFADLKHLSSRYSAIRNIQNEDQISLEEKDVSKSEGLNRINAGKTNLLWNNQSMTNSLLATIPRLELDILFREVSNPPIQGGFITALKICFASDADVMTLLYQPVRLFYRHYHPSSLNHMYQIGFLGQIYSFANNKFSPCQNAEELIGDYPPMIKIKRTYDVTASFENHVSGSDTEYVLFPFQLLYQLMEDNDNNILEIHSVAVGNPKSTDIPLFHSTLLYSPMIRNLGAFAGMYADRSHLCPPCQGIYFGFNRV